MPTDLTIRPHDEPGRLARVGEALGGAGVNIEGFLGIAAGGRGELHVLVEDASAARSALEGAGFEVTARNEAVVVDCEDAPGELGAIARRVADAGINLTFAYLATGTRLVLGAEDLDALREAL